jgi:lipoyl(octanoyl) transferase
MRSSSPLQWHIYDTPLLYAEALSLMQSHVETIQKGGQEQIMLLEHPPLYTSGTSAKASDLLNPQFDVFETGRGGQYTYHGPGQRVAYVMLNLNTRKQDLRLFIATLEAVIINTLAHFNIKGETREGRVGVWVKRPDKGEGYEDKIAALGLRVSKWVTYHGIGLNIDPNLSHFNAINPCGIQDPRFGVTSFHDLGHLVSMPEVDSVFRAEFEKLFCP